jgi:hypothetical protein
MRSATFLLLLFFLTSSGQISFQQPSAMAQDPAVTGQAQLDQPGSDSVRMWRRAEIRVVPLDLAVADRAELQSLRARVAEAESNALRLNVSDPAVREQLARQLQLVRSLMSYAERHDSDRGKSPTAREVQSRLNRIEGQVMCEACHTGVVARLGGAGTSKK